MTTLDPPTKAKATDSFRCIPPMGQRRQDPGPAPVSDSRGGERGMEVPTWGQARNTFLTHPPTPRGSRGHDGSCISCVCVVGGGGGGVRVLDEEGSSGPHLTADLFCFSVCLAANQHPGPSAPSLLSRASPRALSGGRKTRCALQQSAWGQRGRSAPGPQDAQNTVPPPPEHDRHIFLSPLFFFNFINF